MTTPAEVAPAPKRVALVCILCGHKSHAWKLPAQIDALKLSPLDHAYMHVCASHLQVVPADAPIPHINAAGPDRSERERKGIPHSVAYRAGVVR